MYIFVYDMYVLYNIYIVRYRPPNPNLTYGNQTFNDTYNPLIMRY